MTIIVISLLRIYILNISQLSKPANLEYNAFTTVNCTALPLTTGFVQYQATHCTLHFLKEYNHHNRNICDWILVLYCVHICSNLRFSWYRLIMPLAVCRCFTVFYFSHKYFRCQMWQSGWFSKIQSYFKKVQSESTFLDW